MALFCGSMFGQARATLQGTVVDPADAAVPNATIEIKNPATGVVRLTTSTAEGIFRFNGVDPAVYNMTIKAGAGFQTLTSNNLDLTTGEVRELGRLKLTLGAVTQNIEVSAAPTPVETSSSAGSKLVDSTQIGNITMRGRDLFAILQTIPGVNMGNSYLSQGTDETSSETSVGTLSINGGGTANTNFVVDGITDMMPGSDQTTIFEPSVDTIAEIRVLTSNYQAEYGRKAGGTVSVVTKGGGQQFHGGASANKRHEEFNAKNFFTNYSGGSKTPYRFFVWNWQVGGPVYIPHLFNTQKKRMFFYASQEYTRQKPSAVTGYLDVPNANVRAGDFSYYTNSNGQFIANSLRNPLTGAYMTPSANSGATGQLNFAQYLSSFDAQSQKWGQAMMNFLPLPNLCNAAAGTSDGKPWNGVASGATGSNLISPSNCPSFITSQATGLPTGNVDALGGPGTTNNNTRNYYWQFAGKYPRRNDLIRFDFNVTSKFAFHASWNHDFDLNETAANQPARDSTGKFSPVIIDHPNPGHGYAFGGTYTLSPTMVDEFTFGKDNTTWSYYPHDQSQWDRAQMLNPPSFDNFTTDPLFVADQNQPRPAGLGPGSLNFIVSIPTVSYGGGQLSETGTGITSCGGIACPYSEPATFWSAQNSISKVIGAHNLKMGVYWETYEDYRPDSAQQGTYVGNYNFGGGNVLMPHDTNDGWANAYLGNVQNYSEGQRDYADNNYRDWEAFAQDNWRVSRRVTLDLGIRFYHLGPWKDYRNNAVAFVPSTYNPAAAERIFYPYCTVSTATAACPTNTAATIYQYAWDKSQNPNALVGTGNGGVGNMYPTYLSGLLVPLTFNGVSTGGYTTTPDPFTGMQLSDGKNPDIPYGMYSVHAFSPALRLGFAWDVFGDGKTAIRGGFGQFLNRSVGNSIIGMDGQPPRTVNRQQYFGTVNSILSNPLVGSNPPLNQVAGISPYGPYSITGLQAYPGAYNGSFNVQQNLGYDTVLSVGYVFQHNLHQPLSHDLNPVAQMYAQYQTSYLNPLNAYLDQYMPGNASGRNYNDNYFRPIQGYATGSYANFAGSSDYSALQATLRRNFTKHISYGISYNFSKLMSLTGRSDIFTDKFRNWQASYQPTPQVVTFNYVLDEGKIAERLFGFKPLGYVIDDWQVSGLTQWRSNIMVGYPGFSFSNTNSTNLVTPNYTGTPPEGARLIVLGNPELISSQVTFKGGPTTAAALQGMINGTPGNAIFNNASVLQPFPCSLTPQANNRTGVGENLECFGNAGAGSLFPEPNTHIDNWDVTFSKHFALKSEKRTLEFRVETYNIFNHTQFTGASTGQSWDWNTWKTTGALVPGERRHWPLQ